eukprot:gene12525-6348_t
MLKGDVAKIVSASKQLNQSNKKTKKIEIEQTEDNRISKYSCHVTFWRKEGVIIPVREGTYTIRATSEHIKKLKNYEHVQNYTYKYLKNYAGEKYEHKNKPSNLIKFQTITRDKEGSTLRFQANDDEIRDNEFLENEFQSNMRENNNNSQITHYE